jgi:uncharacterized protein (UPF0332 family)
MTLAADLLKQADRLTTLESKRPKQASLRRAISSAYYSLFHLLIDDGARVITSNPVLRPHVARSFQHMEMKKICDAISKPLSPTSHWLAKFFVFPVAAELISVCQTFSDLQEMRHIADYDTARSVTRSEAVSAVSRALAAHEDWKEIRRTDNCKVFLLASAKILVNR